MSTPAVTIVVPGFNVAPWAEEALGSLRAQTYPDFCSVLVNDASTDGTGALFAATAAADERFHVISHSSRRGLSAARNTGLDLVRTPFVGFLDADDRFTPLALERLVNTLTASGSDFVAGAYVRLRADVQGRYTPGQVQPWVRAATDPERRGTTLGERPEASGNVVAWSKISRIDFWRREALRFPEGRIYEDQVLAQRMYTTARAFDVIPDVVVHWRERADGSSLTQQKDALPVLADYLDALRGGLAVLDASGHADASASRRQLILALDVPALVSIARKHVNDEYRRTLASFIRELSAHPLTPPLTADQTAAALW